MRISLWSPPPMPHSTTVWPTSPNWPPMSASPKTGIGTKPVHADHIDRDAAQFSLLVLPNLGAMSDAQVASARRFVAGGGGLVATGETSRFNEWGDPRPDFALADLFGTHVTGPPRAGDEARRKKHASETGHPYLRLNPDF